MPKIFRLQIQMNEDLKYRRQGSKHCNFLEKAKSIFAGNLNSGLTYPITTVKKISYHTKNIRAANSNERGFEIS